MGVDGVVIAVQQIQAVLDARFDTAEGGEEVLAFDPVVTVQVLKEGLQGRQDGVVQPARVEVA